MGKVIRNIFIVIGVLFFASCVMTCVGGMSLLQEPSARVSENSILSLHLKGIIIDGNDETNFLKNLNKYARNESIKGVLIQVDSPGGVVGPSQELYSAIQNVSKQLQKPVVVSGNALMASGAYYAAAAADKIVVNPGTMVGSIGVVLQFANLEKLYSWAKIQRYAITSGKYKDAGADYKPMSPDARKLFKSMVDEVHMQFMQAVATGRNMDLEKVRMYSDGRVFTGETAVRLGFADQMGTFADARKLIGKLTDLGDRPKLFKPPKKRPDFFELIGEIESANSLKNFKQELQLNIVGKPLYVYPGVL